MISAEEWDARVSGFIVENEGRLSDIPTTRRAAWSAWSQQQDLWIQTENLIDALMNDIESLTGRFYDAVIRYEDLSRYPYIIGKQKIEEAYNEAEALRLQANSLIALQAGILDFFKRVGAVSDEISRKAFSFEGRHRAPEARERYRSMMQGLYG